MALSKEEFDNKCMEIIEHIVLIDYRQDRLGAVKVAEAMLEKAKTKLNSSTKGQEVISIYEKVVEEFKGCSDKEYTILRKQLFDIK